LRFPPSPCFSTAPTLCVFAPLQAKPSFFPSSTTPDSRSPFPLVSFSEWNILFLFCVRKKSFSQYSSRKKNLLPGLRPLYVGRGFFPPCFREIPLAFIFPSFSERFFSLGDPSDETNNTHELLLGDAVLPMRDLYSAVGGFPPACEGVFPSLPDTPFLSPSDPAVLSRKLLERGISVHTERKMCFPSKPEIILFPAS